METERCTAKVRLPPLLRDRLRLKAVSERRSLSNYIARLFEQWDERTAGSHDPAR
jgi:hypothetical protein